MLLLKGGTPKYTHSLASDVRSFSGDRGLGKSHFQGFMLLTYIHYFLTFSFLRIWKKIYFDFGCVAVRGQLLGVCSLPAPGSSSGAEAQRRAPSAAEPSCLAWCFISLRQGLTVLCNQPGLLASNVRSSCVSLLSARMTGRRPHPAEAGSGFLFLSWA